MPACPGPSDRLRSRESGRGASDRDAGGGSEHGHRRDQTGRGPAPLVPPIDPAELARRNAALIAALDAWELQGDEREQKETMDVLRQALGPGRTLSSRSQFP